MAIALPERHAEVPQFVVLSRSKAQNVLLSESQGPLVTHVVSIASPPESRGASWSNVKPPAGLRAHGARRWIRALFDDIEDYGAPGPDWYPPMRHHAESILTFLRDVPDDGLLLIHCQAGVSRSAAVGVAFAALHLGSGREDEAVGVAASMAQADSFLPNLRLMEYLDELLERDGRLLAASRDFDLSPGMY